MTLDTWPVGIGRLKGQRAKGGGAASVPGVSRRVVAKAAAALLLLGLLAAVVVVAVQYARTGASAGQLTSTPIPGLPAVVRTSPAPARYVGFLPGVGKPVGVAVGADGRLYVTEGSGERSVRVFDSFGQPAGAFKAAGGAPVYAASSPAGDIYVSDRQTATIQVYSREGALLREIGSPFGADNWQPIGLGFDTSGNLYVTDVTPGMHRVVVLDPAGRLLRQFGKEGNEPGAFSFPNAVAVDDAGQVYVADSNNARVQVFDPVGNLLTVLSGSAAGGLALPRGLAIDAQRHLLFVVDTLGQAVAMFDLSRGAPAFVGQFGAGGDAAGFEYPNGIALDGQGRLYVTDREHDRVQIWSY